MAQARVETSPRLRRRVRVQFANCGVECGAACLAMVLTHFGRHTTVRQAREGMSLGRDGATAATLARASRAAGLEVRPLSLSPAGLRSLRPPAVLHWNANHFVVLERWRPTGVVVVDPAAGRRWVPTGELERCFTGVALEFHPAPTFARRRRPRAAVISFLRPFVPRARGAIWMIVATSVLLAALGLAPAALTRQVVDSVLPHRDLGALVLVGAGMAALTAGNALTGFARAQALLLLENRIDAAMMSGFLRHLLSLPYAYFQLRSSGDLLVRAASTSVMRDLLTAQSLGMLLDGGLVAIYLGVLAALSPGYGAIVTAIGALQFMTMFVCGRWIFAHAERQLLTVSSSQSCLLETITGAETIKASGAEDHAYRRWGALFGDQLRASLAYRSRTNVAEGALSLFSVGTPLLLLWFGAHQVLAGSLTLGSMLALNAIAGSALAPVNMLAGNALQIQTVGVHLARLQDVFNERREQEPSAKARRIGLRGEISLDGVTFRYGEAARAAVSDVSVACPAGSKIALVGRTGSGKSTLAKLMLGLYRPTEGSVAFDGTPLDELDLRLLRRQCGVVMQESRVFSGTLYDNIAFATPEATEGDVVRAAVMAEIHDEIVAMPMGYATTLSEGGGGLSGGQQQRLAIARAVLGRPRILMFDEATSQLDAATEHAIHRNVRALGCTMIVIAHRLSTVRDADLILVLEDGVVAEAGRHLELLARGGCYAKLVAAQLP
jgi:ATP-binding cassette subfamily B protein